MDMTGGNSDTNNPTPNQPSPVPQQPAVDPAFSALPQADVQAPAALDTMAQTAQSLAQSSDTITTTPPLMEQPDVTAVQPAPELPKQGGKKTVLLAVAAVVLIAVAGGGGWFVGNISGKSAGRAEGKQQALAEFQEQAALEDQADVPSEENAQLTLGELKAPEYKNETQEGKIGDQVTANDGLVLMVTNIERNFKTDDANYKLDDSKELIKVNFLLGNITKDKPKDLSSFSFRLENSSGAQLTPESIADYEGKFDTVKIDPGTQTRGSVVYAVNKNEKPLTFTRSQVYRITNQNTEVTTKISIVVAE